jgi:single-stranded-DNA-specific exonuclease
MHPNTIWEHRRCDDEQATIFSRELGVDPVVARLLLMRGLTTLEGAACFLNPSLDQLHDPFLLTDLGTGVERVMTAIARSERIAVHGDYDVDGITSTVILRRMIELLGGDVVHFIPERLRDGYGLQPEAIDRLHELGVRVVVSVDCGIRSQTAAQQAKRRGIDLVITDHHEPEHTLPEAHAVINPRRHDCPYPDKDLAGVGVALKLVHGLCLKSDRVRWLPGFLKLAAIGTVADVVPLTGENRVIARLGLERLTRGPHTVGLQALLEASGLRGKRIGSYEVGFILAPRVNAAGRMSTPDLATRLLLMTDEDMTNEATELAMQLDEENTRRREEEAGILADARRRILSDPTVAAQNILVVWAEGWHRGVIGIVASKLVDEYCRPAIVLSVDGDVAHGSGRSIQGFDLLSALEQCSDLFERFGGHRHAAGMVLSTDRLGDLRHRLAAYANQHLEPTDLVPHLTIDAPLPLTGINGRLIEGLNALEPFGLGNRRPVFHTDRVEVVDGPRSIKNRHLSMTVGQGRSRFRAMAWRAADRAEFIRGHRQGLNLAFSLTENTYRGDTHIELSVADVK